MFKVGYSSIPEINHPLYFRIVYTVITVFLPVLIGIHIYKELTTQKNEDDFSE